MKLIRKEEMQDYRCIPCKNSNDDNNISTKYMLLLFESCQE